MSTTTEYMLDRYGPLLSLSQLAGLFDRSPEGIRISLLHDSDFSRQISPAKLKIGRRVYFRTEHVAKVISGKSDQ